MADEWIYKRISKAINECKVQAANAKKLVGTIRNSHKKELDVAGYDDDDDCSNPWDSDFDDEDDVYNEEDDGQDSDGQNGASYDFNSAKGHTSWSPNGQATGDLNGNQEAVTATGFKKLNDEFDCPEVNCRNGVDRINSNSNGNNKKHEQQANADAERDREQPASGATRILTSVNHHQLNQQQLAAGKNRNAGDTVSQEKKACEFKEFADRQATGSSCCSPVLNNNNRNSNSNNNLNCNNDNNRNNADKPITMPSHGPRRPSNPSTTSGASSPSTTPSNASTPSTTPTTNTPSPKPSPNPRLKPKPKPPLTKPLVPKNKPTIVPRKTPVTNRRGSGSGSASMVKRPSNEPPPPPLPKSPPPNSLVNVPKELDSILDDNNFGYADSGQQEVYETPNPPDDDDYLPPIRVDTPQHNLNRKDSLSTLSFVSATSQHSDSPKSLTPSGLRPQDDYDSLHSGNSQTNLNAVDELNEDTYEVVNDDHETGHKEANCNNNVNILLPDNQRPLLPKVKESASGSSNLRSKLKPDVFAGLSNWTKIVKDKTRDKPKDKTQNELSSPPPNDTTNSSNNSQQELIIGQGIVQQMANRLKHHSLPTPQGNSQSSTSPTTTSQHSSRPLPPLPEGHQQESGHLDLAEESVRSFTWFHDVEREEAENLLLTMDNDGAYVVRESRRAGKSNPYTLTIFHDARVFHLNIRRRADGSYALGREKPREKTFKSVADLITYHHKEPILLTTRGSPAGRTKLRVSPNEYQFS